MMNVVNSELDIIQENMKQQTMANNVQNDFDSDGITDVGMTSTLAGTQTNNFTMARHNCPASWENVIPFDNVKLPQFPIKTLPPILFNHAACVSETTQTSIDMSSISELGTCAAAVQGKYAISPKPDWLEPLNLYAVIVAGPAERKSSVFDHNTKVITVFERKWNQNNAAAITKSQIDKRLLQNEVDSLMRQVQKDPTLYSVLLTKQNQLDNYQGLKSLRLLADDASPEAITSLLYENDGRLAVTSTEGGIFEILAGRYGGNVNMDTFLKAHSGDAIRVDRKGRSPEFIDNPCLTVLLMVQPQVINGLFNNEAFTGRGLTARFLYAMPPSAMGHRRYNTQPIPQQVKDDYNNLITLLLSLPAGSQPEVLTLSPEAAMLSESFANWLEVRLISEFEDIQDWCGKLHGAICRIAGILHLCLNPYMPAMTPVSQDTMQNAISIGRYFLEHAKAAYGVMGADKRVNNAKYVVKQLKLQNQIVFDRVYDIHRLCRRLKVEELKPILQLLQEMNYIKLGNGKVFLNPLCFGSGQ